MTSKALMLAAALAMLACGAMNVRAAELRLLCPVAMRAVMPEIIVQFEKATGDKLATEYATAGAVAERVEKGDAADVAIHRPLGSTRCLVKVVSRREPAHKSHCRYRRFRPREGGETGP